MFLPGNELHRQHPWCGQLAEDRRNLDPPIVGKLRAEPLDVERLVIEIEFLAQDGGKLHHHADRIDSGDLRNMPVHEPRKIEQHREIQLDHFLNVRSLNLDCYPRAIRQLRGMHLRDGRASDRFVVEPLEKFGNRLSQFFSDNGSSPLRQGMAAPRVCSLQSST